jgi:hypothetical protein
VISSRTLLNVIAPIGLATMLVVGMPAQAHAQCIAQQMQGTWRNTNPLTTGITRIAINFPCIDVLPSPPHPDTVHVWGSCTPTDCDWGVQAISYKFWSEAATQYTHVVATYDQGFARKTLRVFLLEDGRLWVFRETRFTDGRLDSSKGEYFVK